MNTTHIKQVALEAANHPIFWFLLGLLVGLAISINATATTACPEGQICF